MNMRFRQQACRLATARPAWACASSRRREPNICSALQVRQSVESLEEELR